MFAYRMRFAVLIAAAVGCLAATGCQHEPSRADAEKKRDQARESEQKAAEAENRAVQDRRDANQLEAKVNEQESKKDFVAQMESKFFVVDGHIKDLDKRRGLETDSARKNEWNARVKQLQDERNTVYKKLGDLKSSAGDEWVAERARVVTAWNDFTGHLNQTEPRLGSTVGQVGPFATIIAGDDLALQEET